MYACACGCLWICLVLLHLLARQTRADMAVYACYRYPTGSAVWGSYVDSVDVKCVSNAYSGMYRACLDLCYHELSVSYIQYGATDLKACKV